MTIDMFVDGLLKIKKGDIFISLNGENFKGDNFIIDGHHRYIALKELGYDKVPVTLINYFSDKIIRV